MEKIKIQGKDYVLVNERLKAFREDHPNYPLISEIVSLTEESCVIKASILNENGQVLATGHAQEDRASSFVNKTSYVENCETSAWGRALANMGYGIDTSVASANEVAMAIAKQELSGVVETHSFSENEIIGANYVLPFGKYKGQTIEDIEATKSDYLDWLLENSNDETVKQNIRKFRDDIK